MQNRRKAFAGIYFAYNSIPPPRTFPPLFVLLRQIPHLQAQHHERNIRTHRISKVAFSRDRPEVSGTRPRNRENRAACYGAVTHDSGRVRFQRQIRRAVFYNGLFHSRSLNGYAFPACSQHLNRSDIINGKQLADEFDIVLKRPDALAIVEVKYRLRKDDVEDLATRKAGNFRLLFPEIANDQG